MAGMVACPFFGSIADLYQCHLNDAGTEQAVDSVTFSERGLL